MADPIPTPSNTMTRCKTHRFLIKTITSENMGKWDAQVLLLQTWGKPGGVSGGLMHARGTTQGKGQNPNRPSGEI